MFVKIIINIIFHYQHAAERGPGHLERGVEQLRAGGGGDPRLPAERGHRGRAAHPGRVRRGAGRRRPVPGGGGGAAAAPAPGEQAPVLELQTKVREDFIITATRA